MVRPTLRLRHDVIHRQVAERKVVLAARAMAFLSAVERVPVRLVGWKLADVRALRDVLSMVDLVEELAAFPQSLLDELGRERGQVDAHPLAVICFSGDKGRGAPAERIQDHVTFIAGSLDDALQQRERFLGRVADALFRLRVDRRDIVPYCVDLDALRLI